MTARSDDPLPWRPLKAPSLAEFEAMAIEAFRRLPQTFRELCADLVIRIDSGGQDYVDLAGGEAGQREINIYIDRTEFDEF